MTQRILAVGIGLGLLVAACGGTEIAERIAEQAEGVENVDIQTDNGSVSVEVETEEGTQSFTSGTELPDGFPLPVPAGFEVIAAGTTESGGEVSYNAVMTGPGDSFEDAVAEYEEFLTAEGFEVERVESSAGAISNVTLHGSRDDVFVNIGVGLSGGETSITLGWIAG